MNSNPIAPGILVCHRAILSQEATVCHPNLLFRPSDRVERNLTFLEEMKDLGPFEFQLALARSREGLGQSTARASIIKALSVSNC